MASRFPLSVVLFLAGLSAAAFLGSALPAPADPPPSPQRASSSAGSGDGDSKGRDLAAQHSDRVPTPSQAAFQVDEKAIETILRVRRHYGSLLEGTVFQSGDRSEDERRFLEALQEVMAEAEGRDDARDSRKTEPVSENRVNARGTDLDRQVAHALELSVWLLERKIDRLTQGQGSRSEIERLQRLVAQIRAELDATTKSRNSR